MKIFENEDEEDFIEIVQCEGDKKSACISVYVEGAGLSCIYLNLEQVEELQGQLAIVASKLRIQLAKEAVS
jgi:hypothetical protein